MSESTKRVEYDGDKSTVTAIANQVKNFMQSLGLSDVTRRRNTVISDRARAEVSRQRGIPIVTITAERGETAEQIADFAGGRVVGSTEPVDDEDDIPPGGDPDIEGAFGQVYKPFNKEEAAYVDQADPEFDTSHPKCEDCAHYDGEGNCVIVPNIDPEDYCERFYADVGFFATGGEEIPDPAGEGRRPDVNLVLWGDRLKALEGGTAAAIIEEIKQSFKNRLGERNVQFLKD